MDYDKRMRIFDRDAWMCPCGYPVRFFHTEQIAHRIHKGKQSTNYIIYFIRDNYKEDVSRKWVYENVLNHDKNIIGVCSAICNDAQNIFFKNMERDNLLREILEEELKY